MCQHSCSPCSERTSNGRSAHNYVNHEAGGGGVSGGGWWLAQGKVGIAWRTVSMGKGRERRWAEGMRRPHGLHIFHRKIVFT